MSQSANNHRPRAARGVDKASEKLRRDRSAVIKATAWECPAWLAHQPLEVAGKDLVQAGVDLGEGEALALQLEGQAEAARQVVVTLRVAWNQKFNIYAGNVELYATKPEDITGLGMPLLDEASYKLSPPLDVTVKYDLEGSLIRVTVRKPPGQFTCKIEISPDPITPGSFQVLKGTGPAARWRGTRRADGGSGRR